MGKEERSPLGSAEEQRRVFLDALFGNVEGAIDVRLIEPDGPVKRIPCADREEAARVLREAADAECNIYTGVASRRTSEATPGAGGKGNLLAASALWVDVDFEEPGARAALETLLRSFPFPPSLRVASGGGNHLYWLFEEPYELEDPAARERFEHVLKGLADYLGGDFRATDASRVLRVPGTTNHPDARKRQRGRTRSSCVLLEANLDRRYVFCDFEAFEHRGAQLRAAAPTGAEYVRTAWDGTLPDCVARELERNPRLRARWAGNTSGLEDSSDSGIDLSVATLLAHSLLTTVGRDAAGQAIEAALRFRRAEAGARQKHEDYFARTVSRALASVQSAQTRIGPQRHATDGICGQAPPVSVFLRDKKDVNVARLAAHIRKEGHLGLGTDGRLYRYDHGVYRPDGDVHAKARTRELLGERVRARHFDEVLAYNRAFLPELNDQPDTDVLNVKNGLLEWRTLELREHTPTFLSTAQLPVTWQPTARCSRIERFLREVLPEDGLSLWYEIAGYTLFGGNPLRKAILLLGPGSNGKSTALAILRALTGPENVSAVSLQVLVENRFAAAEMWRKLANICGDLDARSVKRTDLLKQLTGGDPIFAERKHREPFTFTSHALPIFAANEPPISSDQSQAWFDRWIVLPFERRFEDDQADPGLRERLTTEDELEGFLVEAVRGLRRLMNRGHFEIPVAVRKEGERYRDTQDSVRAFVSDACELTEGWIDKTTLYRAYRTYCEDHGRTHLSSYKFNRHLQQSYRGQVTERKRSRMGWAGIRLLPGYDRASGG
jgi:putative DNA primase/helicase